MGLDAARTSTDESVVVVPSISIERTTASSGTVTQAMEERALFLLLLLRQPRLRMIYVTSQPISEAIIEYYLGLLPGVIPSHARARLTLCRSATRQRTSLSSKLLARPRLLREIRSLIPNPARSHLIPYNTTSSSGMSRCRWVFRCTGRTPASSTWAARPAVARMFEECGVQYPIGAEDLHTVDDIVAAVQGMRARRPSISQAIVKINEGVSGSGNAIGGSARLARSGFAGRGRGDRRVRARPAAGGGIAVGRRLLDGVRKAWRHRRRADHRRRAGESRASRCARLPDGTVELAVHPRPASRRGERSEVSRLCLPGGSRLRGEDRRAGDGGRTPSRAAGRTRPVRGGFRYRARTTAGPGRPTRSS